MRSNGVRSSLGQLVLIVLLCRATIYPILTRLGIDMLSGRIIHLRDDDRFKAVGPDGIVVPAPSAHAPTHHPHQAPPSAGAPKQDVEEGEIWFDWAFVDFWKSNYCGHKPEMCSCCVVLIAP